MSQTSPMVSVVITTFRPETKPYLDECIKSVFNLDYPKDKLEVILVGKESYQPSYPNVKTVATKDDRHTAEGINYGMRFVNPLSEYFFYINDDVILTRDSLKHLIRTVADKEILANGICPTDNYLSYALYMGYQKGSQFRPLMERFYQYDDFKDDLSNDFDALRNAKSCYANGFIFMPWLCMYATLIPRKVWNKIGGMDEAFKTGQCDMDYCYRARMLHIRCVAVLDAQIWHFGGRTSSHTLTDPLRVQNIEYFRRKWGVLPDGISEEELQSLKG